MPFKQLEGLAPELNQADWDFVNSLYDSEIAFTDHHVGLLFEKLRELELYRDALIVLTADHGEEFGERGLIGHGHHLHEEVLHVPLVVKQPGQESGQTLERFVSLVDLAPTVCELTGTAWPARRPRRGSPLSLEPQSEPAGRPVLSELGSARSVVADSWKLMTADTLGGARLYRLADDPGEREDVIGEHSDVAARLRLEIERWSSSLQPECDESRPGFSEEQKDKLRALGYAQ
jgi:arylsulfatase A-like enzyme